MNFRTATFLVLGMFGSFAVVIATMMVLFWLPGGKKTARPAKSTEATSPAVVVEADTPIAEASITPGTPPADPDPPPSDPGLSGESTPTPASQPEPETRVEAEKPRTRAPSTTGRKTQRELQIELKEYRLLREEMDRRLREQEKRQERKLDQLARQCENLGAGETVQILIPYTDELIKRVLERMAREKAIEVATLLKRLGRAEAISIK